MIQALVKRNREKSGKAKAATSFVPQQDLGRIEEDEEVTWLCIWSQFYFLVSFYLSALSFFLANWMEENNSIVFSILGFPCGPWFRRGLG